MKLANLLTQKKTQIVDRWIKLLYDSYPPQTAIFLKKEKDKFDNPVGYRIARGLNEIFDALVQEMETEQLLAA
ncbi:MAG: RsbRD N-terminal domain-containing protein [Deltaproteobacteria bacterium]|nr:RsbRD N-terminal domain-containing protein [Deltaproteobacteria bacterium]